MTINDLKWILHTSLVPSLSLSQASVAALGRRQCFVPNHR